MPSPIEEQTTLCGIDEKYARKHFPDLIKSVQGRPVRANTASSKELKLTEFIDFTFMDMNSKQIYVTVEFYLIPNLVHPLLASLYLIRKCNWDFIKRA